MMLAVARGIDGAQGVVPGLLLGHAVIPHVVLNLSVQDALLVLHAPVTGGHPQADAVLLGGQKHVV